MSDHQSLQFMHTQKGLSGRMARWAMKLAAYNLQINYIKGTSNVVADALSRLLNRVDSDFDRTETLLGLFPELIPQIHREIIANATLIYGDVAIIDTTTLYNIDIDKLNDIYEHPDDKYNISEGKIALYMK